MSSAEVGHQSHPVDKAPNAPLQAAGETPLLLHIGYHKTASSLLQTTLFDREDFGFMRPEGEPRHQLVIDFVRPRPFCYMADEMQANYHRHLEQARQKGLTLVLSHERFSGYPPSGGFDSQILADRLIETFPEASVLIVIREQVSLINSMYSQYITDGGDMDLVRYLSAPERHLMRMPSFSFEFYEFHRLIGYYQKLFGRDRVLVLPYEILKRDPNALVDRIATFCGRKAGSLPEMRSVNSRRPMTMQACQRWGNRFLSENQLSRLSLVPMSRAVRGFARLNTAFDRLSPARWERYLRDRQIARIAEAVGGRYRLSNRETSRLIGIDLADYGYACDEPVASPS